MAFYKNETVGSSLLVGGTAIGAGMLALPLTTGVGGFYHATFLFLVIFLFMLTSLFYLLEATLMTNNPTSNLVTICKDRLGPIGAGTAWISFLMLLYAVAAAYLSGGGSLITDLVTTLFKFNIHSAFGVLIFLTIFGCIIIFDTKVVDFINRVCMVGLISSFLLLLIFVSPHIEPSHYSSGKPEYLWAAVPVVALSFTSHIIIPSLRNYLQSNITKLKKALLWGSTIPLIFYLLWEFLIIGLLPINGPNSLESLGGEAQPIAKLTDTLKKLIGLSWIATLVASFSFFALVTSFFGVALSLYDFLSDGFHIKKTFKGKILLLFLMFTPPILFALFYPHGFMVALGYAGVFVAILYGILPVLMVWHGRYIEKKKQAFRVFGGKALLLIIFTGAIGIIFIQVAVNQKWVASLG